MWPRRLDRPNRSGRAWPDHSGARHSFASAPGKDAWAAPSPGCAGDSPRADEVRYLANPFTRTELGDFEATGITGRRAEMWAKGSEPW